MKYDSKAEPVPTCQSPWCRAYGLSEMMIKSEKKMLRWNGKYYYRPHMYTQCYVKYGYMEKELKWYECGNMIDFVWRRVFPLLSEGNCESDIANRLSTTRYSVLKYAVYFASQSTHGRTIDGEEAIKYFEKLNEDNDGSNIARAKELFGWGQREYFYHYFTPEVQTYLFLLVNSNKVRHRNAIPNRINTHKEKSPKNVKKFYILMRSY
ncbi:hypothetical protein HMSSN036_48720 [Paenibacillus macerans]|nr:hypothetical protein HMSSN036_48720 [Paenibacillus macerans]